MTNLSLLSLKGNQIGRISPNFTANVPNLRYIYLAENQIEKIEPGAMKQFVAAEIMDLSYNNIGNIGADIFNGMENLQAIIE
jgi:Leucine-rich repeat (LRR) protein